MSRSVSRSITKSLYLCALRCSLLMEPLCRLPFSLPQVLGTRLGVCVWLGKIDAKSYDFRCLRCQESFSCRVTLRFSHGKSLRSYLHQCFSDCIGREHKIRLVAAFRIWFEGAIWAPKWQLPGIFWKSSKIAIFREVN